VKATLREFRPADRGAVCELLHELPELYPDAGAWLERRLDECCARTAACIVAEQRGELCGVVILARKDERLKLCNLFVAPGARGRGIGRALCARAAEFWSGGIHGSVYVTVAPQNLAGVSACLGPYGFAQVTRINDRYGPGRDEIVLAWEQKTALLSLRSRHAERIYAGIKTWEFRRVRAALHPGDRVLIYESGGKGLITGEFTVAERVVGTPAEVVLREPNPESRADALAYLEGARVATALRCGQVRLYEKPLTLAELGVARAPQSYLLLSADGLLAHDPPECAQHALGLEAFERLRRRQVPAQILDRARAVAGDELVERRRHPLGRFDRRAVVDEADAAREAVDHGRSVNVVGDGLEAGLTGRHGRTLSASLPPE
jgi:predicted transcriptional regulator/GNAT superfamily N-acetyltransferase